MSLAGRRFLVVEDHAFQRKALVKMLERMGATAPLEAADGEAALAMLRDARPPVDTIITDLDMPGMDGLAFIRAVAASGRHVSIIAVGAAEDSVLASVGSMAAAYGATLLGVLRKPLSQEALRDAIARQQSRPAPEAERPQRMNFSVSAIQDGLARDEFEPWLQPKVALATGQVRGFEALARWRHPEAGVLAPTAFLPFMEQHGLVDDLTWAVLRKAATCCRRWLAHGHDLSLALNLSVRSLVDVQAADRLMEEVLRAGIEPLNVVLELTESAAAGDHLGAVLENLARLRLKGFGLSIDDFGTGYSSVQQLSRIAFTELKIDRSFVRDAAAGETGMVLLQSSLDMARRLKLVSVGEGVESAAEWDLLRRLGCELAQGYWIAKPMPADRVPQWLEEYGARARPPLRAPV